MTGSFWEYFLFYRQARFFFTAWLEGISSLLVQDSFFHFFTQSLGHSVHTSCHPNCCPKTDFFLSISADEEKSYFRFFRVLANHQPLSPSFTLSDDSFGLLSLPPGGGYGVQIAWPTFFTFFDRLAEVELHSLFLF